MLKKTLKIIVCLLLFFLIGIVGVISYLFFSADMRQPRISAQVLDKELFKTDDYRQWGENFLRKSETGLWELKVSGSDFERGLAIGKLSEDLLYYQEKVFVDQIKKIVPSESYLKFLGFFTLLFNRNLGENIPEEYRREIYGISLSCTDEYDYIATPYERQLNYHAAHDLGHAMQDYMLVGCTSFAAWGSNTTDSSLIVGRNFDFYVGDDFARNKEILFYEPDKGYKFVSVAWAGMTGVLSGMNEAGLTVTINAAKSSVPVSAKTPISILTREILQYASTIDEAYRIAKKRETFVSESILIGSAKDKKAAIIEKSPYKTSLYASDQNQEKIICTNHFQSAAFRDDKRNIENILTTDSKYRYQRVDELINQHLPLDEKKAASILRNYKGLENKEIGLTNEKSINQFIAHHSVIFKPEAGIMWVSTSPWQIGKYVAYDLNKIFKKDIDFKNEIYSAEYTIPADSSLTDGVYKNVIAFKRLTKSIKHQSDQRLAISPDTLALYENTNPEYYYTYEVLGDYAQSEGNTSQAITYWQKALTKEIPKLAEKKRILEKLNE